MPLLVFLHIIILVCDLTAIKEPSNRQSTSEGAVQNNVYNIMNVTICSPQAPTMGRSRYLSQGIPRIESSSSKTVQHVRNWFKPFEGLLTREGSCRDRLEQERWLQGPPTNVLDEPVLRQALLRRSSTTSQSSSEGGTDSLAEGEKHSVISDLSSEPGSDILEECILADPDLQNAVRHLPQKKLTKEERQNLAINLALCEEELGDKTDLQSVCMVWMSKNNSSCCLEDLVHALICTKGLGRFVSNIPGRLWY